IRFKTARRLSRWSPTRRIPCGGIRGRSWLRARGAGLDGFVNPLQVVLSAFDNLKGYDLRGCIAMEGSDGGFDDGKKFASVLDEGRETSIYFHENKSLGPSLRSGRQSLLFFGLIGSPTNNPKPVSSVS